MGKRHRLFQVHNIKGHKSFMQLIMVISYLEISPKEIRNGKKKKWKESKHHIIGHD